MYHECVVEFSNAIIVEHHYIKKWINFFAMITMLLQLLVLISRAEEIWK